jgi:hypothetical protein
MKICTIPETCPTTESTERDREVSVWVLCVCSVYRNFATDAPSLRAQEFRWQKLFCWNSYMREERQIGLSLKTRPAHGVLWCALVCHALMWWKISGNFRPARLFPSVTSANLNKIKNRVCCGSLCPFLNLIGVKIAMSRFVSAPERERERQAHHSPSEQRDDEARGHASVKWKHAHRPDWLWAASEKKTRKSAKAVKIRGVKINYHPRAALCAAFALFGRQL